VLGLQDLIWSEGCGGFDLWLGVGLIEAMEDDDWRCTVHVALICFFCWRRTGRNWAWVDFHSKQRRGRACYDHKTQS
jgi:hypothetical protein